MIQFCECLSTYIVLRYDTFIIEYSRVVFTYKVLNLYTILNSYKQEQRMTLFSLFEYTYHAFLQRMKRKGLSQSLNIGNPSITTYTM